jgi:hypothetical protein
MWWNCVRLDLRSSERCDINGLKEDTKRRKPLQHNRVPSQLSPVLAVTCFGFLLHWKPTGSLLHPLQPACVVREIRLLRCVDSETLGGARFCVKCISYEAWRLRRILSQWRNVLVTLHMAKRKAMHLAHLPVKSSLCKWKKENAD